METVTTATFLSPVQVIVGGVAIGAGVYVGYRASQALEKAASCGVGKLRAKMAAKKHQAASSAPAPAPVAEEVPVPAPVAEEVPVPVAEEVPVPAPVAEAPAYDPMEVAMAGIQDTIDRIDEALAIDPEGLKVMETEALLKMAGEVGSDLKKQLQPDSKAVTEVGAKLDQAFASKPQQVVYPNKKKHHHR